MVNLTAPTPRRRRLRNAAYRAKKELDNCQNSRHRYSVGSDQDCPVD
jgi:hypothetical protein